MTSSRVLCLFWPIWSHFWIEIIVRLQFPLQFSTISKSGNLSTRASTNFLYFAFSLDIDKTVSWSFSTITWSCCIWIPVDMPICIKETRTGKETITCPLILRFWSNQVNAEMKAERSAHIKKQDCSKGLHFLYPFIVWIQAAPGWWIIIIYDALYMDCTLFRYNHSFTDVFKHVLIL